MLGKLFSIRVFESVLSSLMDELCEQFENISQEIFSHQSRGTFLGTRTSMVVLDFRTVKLQSGPNN